MMVRRYDAQGGLAITASHNPAEWNALKFIGPDDYFWRRFGARRCSTSTIKGIHEVVGAEMRGVEVLYWRHLIYTSKRY